MQSIVTNLGVHLPPDSWRRPASGMGCHLARTEYNPSATKGYLVRQGWISVAAMWLGKGGIGIYLKLSKQIATTGVKLASSKLVRSRYARLKFLLLSLNHKLCIRSPILNLSIKLIIHKVPISSLKTIQIVVCKFYSLIDVTKTISRTNCVLEELYGKDCKGTNIIYCIQVSRWHIACFVVIDLPSLAGQV